MWSHQWQVATSPLAPRHRIPPLGPELTRSCAEPHAVKGDKVATSCGLGHEQCKCHTPGHAQCKRHTPGHAQCKGYQVVTSCLLESTAHQLAISVVTGILACFGNLACFCNLTCFSNLASTGNLYAKVACRVMVSRSTWLTWYRIPHRQQSYRNGHRSQTDSPGTGVDS